MSYMSERSLEIKEKAKKVGIVILLVIAFLLLEISINMQNKKEAEENNYINYLEQKVEGGEVE
mgnify:FL=1